ncbi:MAG TPA: polyprenyl synthetase family protein [Candidatus Thermoplasmatota archaeon]|nr:polyprenyl synthetase family protein [Candidatus Thermoplasmatota archaeon]
MSWEQALKECAALVDHELPRALQDVEPASLREAVLYYPSLGGKRLRPALAMVACEAAGGKREAALQAGIAAELVHNFSLVHDDIMDRDEQRRGSPSAHVKFGEAAAILAGDALFAEAFEVIGLGSNPPAVKAAMVHELAVASRVLCEGQQRDMELERAAHATAEDYFRMIHGKTGRLFECATRLGGLAAQASPERVEALALYGKLLGRAFQVRDDVLDLVGDPEHRGKPYASDVRRGKRTILYLLAHDRARGADADTLRAVVGNLQASRADLERAVAVYRSTGAVDDAQRMALDAAREAQAALAALPSSNARGALEALAKFSAERRK